MDNSDETIIINLEDLSPEPEKISISENDLEAVVVPVQPSNPVDPEDVLTIEIPDIPCAIDHTMIEAGQAFGKCKFCETLFHSECWEYNGGCATLGCRGVKNPGSFQKLKALDGNSGTLSI